MFTLNNPQGLLTEEDFVDWGARYLVFQEEMAPETGTLHLQGYIEMDRPVRFTHFTGLEGAHFDVARGTPKECSDYCKKEESRVGGPYIFGAQSVKQGQRTDLLKLRDAVRDGKRGRALFDDDDLAGSAIKFGRGVDAMARAYSSARPRDDLEVVFHYGPAGTGKSHCAHQANQCELATGNGFWLNYNDEPNLLLEEFGGHFMPPAEFLKLADKYAYTANVKGGQVPVNVCRRVFFYLLTNYYYRLPESILRVTICHRNGGVTRPSSTLRQSTVVYL